MENPHDIMYYNTDGKDEVQESEENKLQTYKAPDSSLYDKEYNDAALPATWEEKGDSKEKAPAVREYYKKWSSYIGTIPKEEERWKRFQNYYYNCIQDSDDQIMNILQEIIEQGMLDNTVILFTADHGEMQGNHGLSGKGGFIYENNTHVPMVIVHLEYEGGKSVDAVTSHLDLATTLIDMSGASEAEKEHAAEGLTGGRVLKLMDGSKTRIREGSLFAFEMLSMVDADAELERDAAEKITNVAIDLEKRGYVRGVFTERYKFARYFSPKHFNTPMTIEELYENNDVELYDLKNDPEETNNLAANPEKNKKLIMKMNAKLNKLVSREIGTDNGSEVKEVFRFIKEKAKARKNEQ